MLRVSSGFQRLENNNGLVVSNISRGWESDETLVLVFWNITEHLLKTCFEILGENVFLGCVHYPHAGGCATALHVIICIILFSELLFEGMLVRYWFMKLILIRQGQVKRNFMRKLKKTVKTSWIHCVHIFTCSITCSW